MVYCYTDPNGVRVCDDSSWNKWGRWVAIGILIFAFLSIIAGFLLFAYAPLSLTISPLLTYHGSCLSSRRRIRAGRKPLYGTSWAAPPPYTREDPHPESTAAQKEEDLELDDSPAPSYREATESSASPGSYPSSASTTPQVNVATVAVVVPGAEPPREPGRVADPDGRREF